MYLHIRERQLYFVIDRSFANIAVTFVVLPCSPCSKWGGDWSALVRVSSKVCMIERVHIRAGQVCELLSTRIFAFSVSTPSASGSYVRLPFIRTGRDLSHGTNGKCQKCVTIVSTMCSWQHLQPPVSSRSVFRSKSVPKIHYGFTTATATPPHQHQRSVEIWTTTCIVTNFGRTILSDSQHTDDPHHRHHQQQHHQQHQHCWVLVNPCNSGLTGCRLFPYFPKGGPVPPHKVDSPTHRDWQPLGYVTQWGGMEVGTGMLYPTSVVDGLVHTYGGSKLQTELYWLRQKHWWTRYWWHDRTKDVVEPCPIGHAVITSAGNGLLAHQYDYIVHTAPPFYKFNTDPFLSSEALLLQCYENALQKAVRSDSGTTTSVVAMPLLGSGARGFPVHVACQVAAEAIVDWLWSDHDDDDDDGSTHGTSTNYPIQRHVYLHNSCDKDNNNADNDDDIPTPTASPIDTTIQDATLAPTCRERIVLGLLDRTTAEQLADEITKRIQCTPSHTG